MAASLNGNNKMFLFSLTVLSSWVLITGSIPSVVTDFPLFEITKEFDDIITFNDHAILKFQEQEPMENLTCASCEGSSERECTLNQTAVVCDQDPDAACLTFEAFNNFTMTTTFRRGCFLTGIFCDNACRSFNVSQDGNLTSCVQDCCNSSLCNAGSLPTEVTTEASTTAKETTAASTTAKQTETTASSTTAKQTTEASTTAKQTTAPSTTTKQTTAISTTAVTTKPTTTKQTTTTTAPTTAPTTIPTPIACGGVLRTRGTFTSPGFPGNYPNNVRCEWRVFLPRGRRGVFRIVSLVLADSGDSLEFFDSGRVVRSFRGPTRRTRSLSHDQTTNEKVLGEGEDGYYDDQEYVDYYYYDRRRKREPYFYQRRKKRRQQMVGLVVIQGRNQVVSSVFQSDAAGNTAGFSAGFVQGRTDTETDTSASSESSDED